MNYAVLDHRGLGVHAHDLVRLRLVAGDRVEAVGDQLLDQLGALRLVLDQHDSGVKGSGLLAHRSLQLRILHALAQHMQQKEALAPDPPGCAPPPCPPPHAGEGRVGAELARLVGTNGVLGLSS
jgi:hypothetical protein